MHYLLVNISKQMSLNKIIFFLLHVMPEGQIKGAEQLPDNVQCTQTMTSGSPSLCQSGSWDTEKFVAACVSLSQGQCFPVQGSLMSLPFKEPFQSCTSSDFKDHLFLADLCGKRVQVSRDGLAGSKIFLEADRIRAGTTLQLSKWNTFNQCV